jgi:hypothetical protein
LTCHFLQKEFIVCNRLNSPSGWPLLNPHGVTKASGVLGAASRYLTVFSQICVCALFHSSHCSMCGYLIMCSNKGCAIVNSADFKLWACASDPRQCNAQGEKMYWKKRFSSAIQRQFFITASLWHQSTSVSCFINGAYFAVVFQDSIPLSLTSWLMGTLYRSPPL